MHQYSYQAAFALICYLQLTYKITSISKEYQFSYSKWHMYKQILNYLCNYNWLVGQLAIQLHTVSYIITSRYVQFYVYLATAWYSHSLHLDAMWVNFGSLGLSLMGHQVIQGQLINVTLLQRWLKYNHQVRQYLIVGIHMKKMATEFFALQNTS